MRSVSSYSVVDDHVEREQPETRRRGTSRHGMAVVLASAYRNVISPRRKTSQSPTANARRRRRLLGEIAMASSRQMSRINTTDGEIDGQHAVKLTLPIRRLRAPSQSRHAPIVTASLYIFSSASIFIRKYHRDKASARSTTLRDDNIILLTGIIALSMFAGQRHCLIKAAMRL